MSFGVLGDVGERLLPSAEDVHTGTELKGVAANHR